MGRKTTTCRGCWRYECFSFAGGSILYHYCAKADGWHPCYGKGCEEKERIKPRSNRNK